MGERRGREGSLLRLSAPMSSAGAAPDRVFARLAKQLKDHEYQADSKCRDIEDYLKTIYSAYETDDDSGFVHERSRKPPWMYIM